MDIYVYNIQRQLVFGNTGIAWFNTWNEKDTSQKTDAMRESRQ